MYIGSGFPFPFPFPFAVVFVPVTGNEPGVEVEVEPKVPRASISLMKFEKMPFRNCDAWCAKLRAAWDD
jgi:hypothetical protein